jgi:2-polyprenyl-3-methyl-5-hydroxy-6-metoxy-1,4-benzoquinol methylase
MVLVYDERVCCFHKNDSYYAHLSIYHFASRFCEGKVVFDAGCGTGYGSAYFAEHGARQVLGVDADAAAIEFSKKHFVRENLRFDVADLRKISGSEDRSFDLVFASNSLEHVEGVELFFREAWRLLSPDGVLVVAVPSAKSESSVAFELSNPYHLNIWSPDHWFDTLKRYFQDVRCFAHELKDGTRINPASRPDETKVRETDFIFTEGPVTMLYRDTFTAIFVARNPVPAEELPEPGRDLLIRDHSVSRKSRPAWMHPFQWAFYKSVYILRYEGLSALPGRIWDYARRSLSR